jgi:hypothetical protein
MNTSTRELTQFRDYTNLAFQKLLRAIFDCAEKEIIQLRSSKAAI